MIRRPHWMIVIALLALTPFTARAQTTYTKADNTAPLDQAASWNPASLPTSADNITWNGTYANGTVSTGNGTGLAIRQVQILNPSQPITISTGGNLTVGSGGVDLSQAQQNLTIEAPVVLSAAQLWAVGPGRTLLVTGNLTGNNSNTITVNGGNATGHVVLSPATGQSVNLSGNSTSAFLVVARSGGLLVLGGDGSNAPATTSNNTLITSSGYGALTVTGNGTVRVNSGTWNFGDLARNGSADFFSGRLDVRGGTLAFNGARFLGAGNITVSGGTLKVTNVGSIYSNGGKFALGSVGSNGTATLQISGGLVDLAQANGSVNGGNSLGVAISTHLAQTGGTFQNGITVGGGTNGGNTTTLTIGHSGLTSSGSGANITYTPVSNILASYTLSGGTLLSAGAIQGTTPASPGTNGSSGSPPNAVVNPGTGNIRNFNFLGGTLAVGAFNATALGYASANGTAGGPPHSDPAANSVGIGTLYNHGGCLSPGGNGTAGRTTLTGNYVATGGSLAIDIGGTTQATGFQNGQYDCLSVSGSATLGGNLILSRLSSFTPAANATFTILTSTANLTGSFANAPSGSRILTSDGLGSFVITQSGGNLTLGQYLAVTAPAVTSSSAPATVLEEETVTFSVAVQSLAPVTYQWRKNGVAIDGATSSSFVIPSAASADSGTYDVVLTNSVGTTTSSAFTLTVALPRTTRSVVVPAGSSHTFQASAGALAYQWLMNGAATGNGTSSFTYQPDVNAVGTHWLQVRETYSDNSTYTRQWGVRVSIDQPTPAITLYVAPNGSDSNDGSIGAPFLTLEKARNTLRALPRPLPAGGAMVYLRGGTYTRTSTFTLNATDSGSSGAPVVYAGYPGETAIISGGKSLLSSQFTPLASSELSRVAPGVDASRIWEVDLASLGVVHKGPFPNTFNEWQIRNVMAGGSAGLLEVFYNGERKILSRYPNRNLADDSLTANLKMNGVATGADTAGTGYLNVGGNYTTSNGTVIPVGGAFHYNTADEPNILRWQSALAKGGVWVVGYWRVPWQINGAKVGFLDTGTKKAIALANGVSISNGIGNKYSRPAGSKTEPYWVVNLLEEMDQPGEWCVDFSRNRLYFLMDSAAQPADNSIVLSDLGSALVQISGNHTTFQSIRFEYGLGQGVQILGGSRNLVTGCTFRNMGGYPVDMNNFSGGTYNGVVSCNMEELASGGVLVRGGNNTASPRVPHNNFVVNNRVNNYARVVRVYAAAVDAGYQYGKPSVGARIAHNTTSGSPHVGMLWRDYDHQIEYNDISNYCYFSNDMGGIYAYASNYLSNSTIRYNYVHDSKHGEGIYFDSDHINATVYGNTVNLRTDPNETRGTGFYDQTPGGTPTAGVPLTDTYINNVAVNCRFGFKIYSAPGGTIERNLTYDNYTSGIVWNRVTANATAYTSSSSNATVLASGPNKEYTTDPGFVDFAADDFRFRPDSRAFTDLPGFQAVPLEMAGLYNDEYRSDAKVYPPFITTDRASNLGSNVATFNGTLVYPQFDANATVYLYWGTTDGGTTAASWDHAENLGTPGSGTLSRTLSSLTPGTQYYFRFYAVNSAGEMWAEQSNACTTYPSEPVATGGTPSASSEGTAAALALDGNASTAWQTSGNANTGWIQYRFAGATTRQVTQYQVTSAADNPARDPRDWRFLGSNDGLNWAVLDTRSGEVFTSRGQTKTYGFTNNLAFAYYRLEITANNGDPSSLHLADWQLFSPIVSPDTTGPVITTPGNITVAAGSSSGAVVDFEVTAVDAVTGIATPTVTPPSGSLFAIGTTTVNITATDAVGNTSLANFTVTVTAPGLPNPWSVRNVGSYNFLGTATHNGTSGNFTVNATGGTTGITGDIWTGNNDNFTYVSQPWTGDGIFTARLASFTSTDSSAKAGIMFRETTSVGSKYSFMYLLRKGDAWAQHKTATSGATSGTNFFTNSVTGRGVPEWIRLVRSGNTFSCFYSSNGTSWTALGANRTITLNGNALTVGFAVGPRTANGTATAVFDNVSFLGKPAAPAGLTSTPGSGQVALAWSPVANADSYSVYRAATLDDPFEMVATGLTTPSYSDTGLSPGSSAYYQITATNVVGEGSASSMLNTGPLDALSTWRLANLGSSSNNGTASNDADPDRDGLSNLMEYALGTSPQSANPGVAHSLGASRDRLRLVFNVIADPWITYRVEATGNLLPATWTTVSEFRGGAGVAGTVEIADIVAVGASNPDRRFMRLVVTHSPPP
ncbi:MAG: discoidin domain-containing protein [Candidatus Methylacidiphilales bacterium]|nr:discoidin domain-containing protein [Candidatus Methylacidiphilales bacterium]